MDHALPPAAPSETSLTRRHLLAIAGSGFAAAAVAPVLTAVPAAAAGAVECLADLNAGS